MDCGLIPGIGGLVKFVQGPLGVMAEAYSKYGDVFTVPVGNKRMTFLIGPTPSVHFFRGSDVARKQMSDISAKIIENRRAQPAGAAKEEDVLQTFVEARYSEAYGGREMTVDEVTGMLIAALFA